MCKLHVYHIIIIIIIIIITTSLRLQVSLLLSANTWQVCVPVISYYELRHKWRRKFHKNNGVGVFETGFKAPLFPNSPQMPHDTSRDES